MARSGGRDTLPPPQEAQQRFHGRSLGLSLVLLGSTIAGGLAVRFARFGWPLFLVKYGGSALWALMIYWLVSAIFPRQPAGRAALLAGTVATAVEFLKLDHQPALDAFRLTLPGILLLGRFFSSWDIAVYWVAIALGAGADWQVRRFNGGV